MENSLDLVPVSGQSGWFLRPWTFDEAVDRDAKIYELTKAKDTKGKMAYILANTLVSEDKTPLFSEAEIRGGAARVFGPVALAALRVQGMAGAEEKNESGGDPA